jgi:GxxExxY protein
MKVFSFSSSTTFIAPDGNLSDEPEILIQTYQPDFICHDKIIVELKAVKALAAEHRAQAINYLKATGLRLALLVNFGHYPQAEIERLVL